jgi:L-fuconolactonase
MRIDSHQHFWNYNAKEHIWMNDEMNSLKRNFAPQDLEPLLQKLSFDGCISVQARQSLEETRWLLELAGQNSFIKGVVGWVDLRSKDLDLQLKEFSQNPKFVGVRHVIHDEPDDKFMLGDDFMRGIALVKKHDLSYDLLLYPKHLPIAVDFLGFFPDQYFVLDHIGKPNIAKKDFSTWSDNVKRLAHFPKVFCKLSGMVTEAIWFGWKKQDFLPYMDKVIEVFGTDRVMIGSDWPVCQLSGSYAETMNIVIEYLQSFSKSERDGILGENCAYFYGIEES